MLTINDYRKLITSLSHKHHDIIGEFEKILQSKESSRFSINEQMTKNEKTGINTYTVKINIDGEVYEYNNLTSEMIEELFVSMRDDKMKDILK